MGALQSLTGEATTATSLGPEVMHLLTDWPELSSFVMDHMFSDEQTVTELHSVDSARKLIEHFATFVTCFKASVQRC